MNFLRLHWFDVGLALALIVLGFLLIANQSALALLLWINLLALFLHQAEEYRYPGYFPGMMNVVMFASRLPDRYPLNTNTALIVNVTVGWGFYLLAAIFGLQAPWLALATILVSAGNVIAHVLLFNVRGKSLYNPGMATAVILFLPIVAYFFVLVFQTNLLSMVDWALGIILGAALNYIGILKLIDWLKDESTPYVFPRRFLPPGLR